MIAGTVGRQQAPLCKPRAQQRRQLLGSRLRREHLREVTLGLVRPSRALDVKQGRPHITAQQQACKYQAFSAVAAVVQSLPRSKASFGQTSASGPSTHAVLHITVYWNNARPAVISGVKLQRSHSPQRPALPAPLRRPPQALGQDPDRQLLAQAPRGWSPWQSTTAAGSCARANLHCIACTCLLRAAAARRSRLAGPT